MYQRHVFFCTNVKGSGKKCCGQVQARTYAEHMKSELKKQDLHGAGLTRVSQSGCLGRCQQGPCIVIYPEGTWYTYSSIEDIDKIISSHIRDNQVVSDLMID